MKFLNMMTKYYTKQEAAPAPEGGGSGGLATPPIQQPTPAPAPAPAATEPQPAPQPAPVATSEPTPAPQQTFEPISVEQQQGVMNYVMQAGLEPAHVEQEMEAYGKLSDVTISILKQKHGEHADLVISSIQHMHEQYTSDKRQAAVDTHNTVAELLGVDQAQGGAEFGKMINWLGQSEFAAQGGELADMIEAGGLSRRLALESIANNYRAAQGAQLVSGEPPAPTPNTGMTMAEYNQKLPELVQKFGYESPQVKALQAQRNAARAAGIN